MRRIPVPKPLSLLAVMATSSLLATGCGQQAKFANKPRQPSPVTVTASITQGRISLSPPKIGAGPIVLSVANLSRQTLSVKLEPVDAGKGLASSGPISPDGTAQLSVDVEQGSYRVSARGASVAPAELAVTAERQSSQNDVLLP